MQQVVLTIGGSDSGGGAGIQADLKTFSALGLHGTCAITAITAQNTLGVQKVVDIDTGAVCAQLDSVISDFSVAYAKTGMLNTAENVLIISERLKETRIPFVLDPVIEAEAGGRLLRPDALSAIKECLIPLARVVTPNIFEAKAITGIRVRDIDSSRLAAHKIMELGPESVIIKGGHLDCTDLLVDGELIHCLKGNRIDGQNHGVGCTYSAALTSFLALDYSLKDAADKAKRFAEKALMRCMRVGKGSGPVNQVAFLQEEANRFRVLCDMQKALDLFRENHDVFETIPDAGSELGMAIPSAVSSRDIAELNGMLIRMGNRVEQSGCIMFGANGHISKIILEAMRFDTSARAAMSLRSEMLPDSMVDILMTMKSDWRQRLSDTNGKRMDLGTSLQISGDLQYMILDEEHNGESHGFILIGSSPTQLALQAIRLARLSRDRKI